MNFVFELDLFSKTIHKNSNSIKQRIQEELFLADNSYKIIVANYKKESIAFANTMLLSSS